MHPTRNLERQVEVLRRRLTDAEALVRRLSQQTPLFSGGGGQGGGGGSAPGVGYADGDISALSGSTLGSGSVALYSTSGGTLTDIDVSIEVYNTGEAIADGTRVLVQRDRNNTWLVAPDECGGE